MLTACKQIKWITLVYALNPGSICVQPTSGGGLLNPGSIRVQPTSGGGLLNPGSIRVQPTSGGGLLNPSIYTYPG